MFCWVVGVPSGIILCTSFSTSKIFALKTMSVFWGSCAKARMGNINNIKIVNNFFFHNLEALIFFLKGFLCYVMEWQMIIYNHKTLKNFLSKHQPSRFKY